MKAFFLVVVLACAGCSGLSGKSAEPSQEFRDWQQALQDAFKVGRGVFNEPADIVAHQWEVSRSSDSKILYLMPANAPLPSTAAEFHETPKLFVVCNNGTVKSWVRYYQYVRKPISQSMALLNGQLQSMPDSSVAIQVWFQEGGKTKLLNPPVLGLAAPGVIIDRTTGAVTPSVDTKYERLHDILLRGANGLAFIDPIAFARGEWWGKIVFRTGEFQKAFNKNCY